MQMIQRRGQQGSISGSLIAIILLVLAIVLLSALAVWLYVQFSEQKSNVDAKIGRAVAEAKKDQKDADEEDFAEREKEPNYEFVGPDDYGRLTFHYPKTWSAYVASDIAEGGDYQAYLHPKVVPPVESEVPRFALRVLIESRGYDEAIDEYKGLVEDGDLRSSAVNLNGVSGTRFDGKFSDDIRGAVVVFKVRDKTVSLFTDADTFKPDFEKIIKSVKFNV